MITLHNHSLYSTNLIHSLKIYSELERGDNQETIGNKNGFIRHAHRCLINYTI